MVAIVVENVPPRLRGRLAVRLLEIRAGVYVGRAGARLRHRIWDEVLVGLGEGSAVMAWSAQTEQGYRIETAGRNRRVPVDFGGLILVSFEPASDETSPEAEQAPEVR